MSAEYVIVPVGPPMLMIDSVPSSTQPGWSENPV